MLFMSIYLKKKNKTAKTKPPKPKQLSTQIGPINLSLKGNQHFALAPSLLMRDDFISDYSLFLKNKMKFMHVSKVYAKYIYTHIKKNQD